MRSVPPMYRSFIDQVPVTEGRVAALDLDCLALAFCYVTSPYHITL